MKPIVAARSDVGKVRTGNEDSYLVHEPLFAVADGMGGHLGGEIASATAVETIVRAADEDPPQDAARLAMMVRDANSAVWEKAQRDPELRGMGTTCTLVLLADSQLHLAHVGDSRAYLYRSGELTQLTEDHTLVNRMVREGRLKVEEAERHPQRSIITRALGVDAEVQVDEISLSVEEGDRLLLCSDGLTSMIDLDALATTLAAEGDPQVAVDRLVDLANDAGGEDNVTVVLIDIAADDGSVPARSSRTRAVPEPEREDTEPDAVNTAPPAVDTGVHRLETAGASSVINAPQLAGSGEVEPQRRRRLPRVLGLSLLLLLVIGAVAFAATRYTLANSYFVGTDEEGVITIYRGIPEDIAGLTLKESHEQSNVSVDELPDFLRGDVEEGIKAESLNDARSKVADLEERANDSEFDKPTAQETTN